MQKSLSLELNDFGARMYDPQLGRWNVVDPLAEKYPSMSPYVAMANNPVMFVDPDGRDIVLILDKEAAAGNGHIAVLIGNELNGWNYVSVNGTGKSSKPWGLNKNADVNTKILTIYGNVVLDMNEAVNRANKINKLEKHSYDYANWIISTESEDREALEAASRVAREKYYGIAGSGVSCIDVAQAAFKSIVESRELTNKGSIPGEGDLIPNNWWNMLTDRVDEVNNNAQKDQQKIIFNKE